jgi:hypothetical protein
MNKLFNISDLELSKSSGINKDITLLLASFLNDTMQNRKAPLYIFFHPDIDKLAGILNVNNKELFHSLKYLACIHSNFVKLKAILDVDFDDLFYVLQDEDIEELKRDNKVHNPKNPNIVYENADQLVRHAFVVRG